jgi:transposase-like protein
MKKIPYGRYTPEFREEAAKLVSEGGLSAGEAARPPVFTKVNLGELG